MMTAACFNLDTRRDSFATTVDLDRADAFVDVLAFETPEEVLGETAISLVSHAAGLTSGEAVGWRTAEGLAAQVFARAGARLTLALRREDLARSVASARGREGAKGAAVVALVFTTIMDTPRGPKASARRTAHVTVLAGASRPEIRIEASGIDLDAPADGRLTAAELAIILPADLVLEARRGIVIDAGCGGLAGRHLALSVAGAADFAATLTGLAAPSPGLSRHLVAFPDGQGAAGRTLRLRVAISRDALLDRVEELVRVDPDAPPLLRLSVKAAGWTDGEAEAGGRSARRWTQTLEAPAIPILSGRRDDAVLSVFGTAAACALDGAPTTLTAENPITADVDPDDEAETVRLAPLMVDALRWPLTRAARLVVRVSAEVDGERIAEPPVPLPLEIVRLGASGRRGRASAPLRALAARLSRAARSGGRAALPRTLRIDVEIVAVDLAERVLLRASAPVVFVRRVRRQPVVIDLGATATAVWAGAPETAGKPVHVRPLPLGGWLARHLGVSGGDDALISSAVGLDPRRNLRAESLPHTLPDLALAGSDSAAIVGRLQAFGRRYDVSVPAPNGGSASNARRVDGLKRALAGGETTLRLADPAHRYDPATGKAVSTSAVEVVALAADVLDELMDLYVLRLAAEGGSVDEADPAPIAPRILLARPTGVADEMERRYRPALDLFRRRLERLYPGAGAYPDLVATVPEGVAAARHIAGLIGDAAPPSDGGDTLLVALDIGGGTSDVAVVRLGRAGGRRAFDVVAAFGVAFGADAIDGALTEIIAARIDASMAAQTAHWRQTFEEPSLAKIDGRDDPTARALRRRLRAAVLAAKVALTARLLAAAEAMGSPYGWSRDEGAATLDVALAASDDGSDGLFAPIGAPGLGDEAAASGLALERGADGGSWRLILRVRRIDVENASGPQGARLTAATEALGVTLLRMARAASPTPARRPTTLVVPTGRGALWPPVFEAMAAEAAASHTPFPYPRPFSPAAMKAAVVAGAALLAADGGLADVTPERRNPLALAAIGARMRRLDGPGVATELVAERILYLGHDGADAGTARLDLGRRFHFVRAVPGLDPNGRTLAALRPLLDGGAPLILLDGDAVVEARREGVEAFGVCDVTSEATGPAERKVVVAAPAEGWEACWTIAGDRAVRLY